MTIIDGLAYEQMPGQLPPDDSSGAVYLLCFSAPFKGKRHYLGWAGNLADRLRAHFNGNQASVPFVKAAHAAGIRFACVRWWPGDRHLEGRFHYRGPRRPQGRSINGRHGLRQAGGIYCPRCCGRYGYRNPGQTIDGYKLPAGWIEPAPVREELSCRS